MSDVLSRILADALRGGGDAAPGGDAGHGARGGTPLGAPRLPADEAGRFGGVRSPAPMQEQGGLGGMVGSAMADGGMGSGLGALLRGMLGSAPGDGSGPPGATIAGGRQVAITALLAWLMRGHGGAQGLSSLTEQLRSAGLGSQVDSWISTGPNGDLRPEELARAIPPDTLDDIEAHTGIGREEVLSELSRGLPGMVDRLTPQGRLPERDAELDAADEEEIRRELGLGPSRA